MNDKPAPATLPFPLSRCHQCSWVRYNGNTRGSIFVACTHAALPKYLPQPVTSCSQFAPKAASSAS